MPIDLMAPLASASVRAAGPGLVTFAGLWLFRIRSSAARHAAWTAVIAGMLLQIPLGLVAPKVPLKALSTLPAHIELREREWAQISVPAATILSSASRTLTKPKARPMSFRYALTGLYLAISMLLFIRMALGYRGLRRILRDARPVVDVGPEVFESVLLAVPGSVGCCRPRILLPRAWRDWGVEKLRAVLAHERAHIRRQDWLIRVVSDVNVCIFWFHPLAWWMDREVARLAEEACDDVALCEMEDREEYAATLVDMARASATQGVVVTWRVISMAKDSNVMRRVNRILNPRLRIAKPLGGLAWVTLFACSLPVIYLSAAVKLAPSALLPEQKSPVTLIAQAGPSRPPGPAPAPAARPPAAPVVTGENVPITMCIVMDNSGSMRDKQAGARAAALALMRASRPGDQVCLVDFNDETYLDLDFTGDIRQMEGAIARFDARGGKAMREAVRMSLDHLEQGARNNRKVLVLVTEGNDNASAVTQEQLLGMVRNSGVRVYCIGLVSEDDLLRAGTAKRALGQLAGASGGLDYYPADLAEVERISPEIASQARK